MEAMNAIEQLCGQGKITWIEEAHGGSPHRRFAVGRASGVRN
jgi:hypothetical protein